MFSIVRSINETYRSKAHSNKANLQGELDVVNAMENVYFIRLNMCFDFRALREMEYCYGKSAIKIITRKFLLKWN